MKRLLLELLQSTAKFVGVFTFTLILFPKFVESIDVRSAPKHPLRISLHPDSPAMIAIQEVQSPKKVTGESSELSTVFFGAVTLNSGEDSNQLREILNEKINIKDEPVDLFKEAPRLRGLRISQSSDVEINNRPSLPAGTISAIGLAKAGSDNSSSQSKSIYLSQAFEEPRETVQSKAQRLVEQELESRKQTNTRTITSSSGGQIMVMAPEQASADPLNTGIASSMPAQASKSSKQASPWAGILESNSQLPSFTITGKLRFPRELSEDEKVAIYHIDEELIRSEGTVWARDFRYEVSVKQKSGYLLAEVIGRNGQVVLEERVFLESVQLKDMVSLKVTGVDLTLRPPEENQILVDVESGYSFADNSIEVPGVKVRLLPFETDLTQIGPNKFAERGILKGSTAIVEAVADRHWPTQTRVIAGKNKMVRVFHENLMKAFLEIIGLKESEHAEAAVLWGVVKHKGKPVPGAQVEIESYESGSLSFFKFNLPDLTMGETDKSGQFVWAGSRGGRVSLRVTYKNQQFPAQVVTTQGGVVSWIEVDFEGMKPSVIQVKPLIFNDKEVYENASVRMLGAENEIIGVKDKVKLKVQTGTGLHLTEMDAGYSFLMTRQETAMSQGYIDHLLIPTDWLSKVQGLLNASDSAEEGYIVGILPESGGEVFAYNEYGIEIEPPVYFNEQGELVKSAKEAFGFMYLNVSPGLHSVGVFPNDSDQTILRTLNIDSGYAALVTTR